MTESSAVLGSRESCLNARHVKEIIIRGGGLSQEESEHISGCPVCQKAITRARTDVAWHGR